MGEITGIEWTDHTFNPWIGCTKVSAACDHCYAEALVKRYGWATWGAGEPRKRTAAANWRQPIAWNKAAAAAGIRRRVFCASLADVFDTEVPPQWRIDLFQLIWTTPYLDWLLLTKRPQVAKKFFDSPSIHMPPNVWLGTTVEDQKMAELRIPILLSIPAKVRFLSCEPLLSRVSIMEYLYRDLDVTGRFRTHHGKRQMEFRHKGLRGDLHWIIAGGESGPKARPSHPDWFRSLRDQCAAAGVPFFFKQWGEWVPIEGMPRMVRRGDCFISTDGRQEILGADLGSTLEGVATPLRRVGKMRAGATLDGREHREFPTW